MKKIICVILLLVACSLVAYSQVVKTSRVQDAILRKVLSSVDTVIVKSNYNIAVTIFRVSNGSGSAHIPETEEVTHKFIISISTVDEAPEINVYQVANFYNPKVLKFELLGEQAHIVIEYGVYKQRKRVDLIVTVKNIMMKNG